MEEKCIKDKHWHKIENTEELKKNDNPTSHPASSDRSDDQAVTWFNTIRKKNEYEIKKTMLQTTLPKRHVTRGVPSGASGEFDEPKVSCKYNNANKI